MSQGRIYWLLCMLCPSSFGSWFSVQIDHQSLWYFWMSWHNCMLGAAPKSILCNLTISLPKEITNSLTFGEDMAWISAIANRQTSDVDLSVCDLRKDVRIFGTPTPQFIKHKLFFLQVTWKSLPHHCGGTFLHVFAGSDTNCGFTWERKEGRKEWRNFIIAFSTRLKRSRYNELTRGGVSNRVTSPKKTKTKMTQ